MPPTCAGPAETSVYCMPGMPESAAVQPTTWV